jgi:hypothetical protein
MIRYFVTRRRWRGTWKRWGGPCGRPAPARSWRPRARQERARARQERARARAWQERALGRSAEAYVAGRAAIVACGRSADGLVAVRVEGMRRWRVEVAAEACGSRAVAEVAVRQAAEALLRDQAEQIRALKHAIWGR